MLHSSSPAAISSRNRDQHDLASYRTLRLLLPEAEAIRMHSANSPERVDDRAAQLDRFRGMTNQLVWLHRYLKLRNRLSSRKIASSDPPLGPQSGVTSRDALALAFRVGLQLDADEISDVLRTSVLEAGRRVYTARAKLLGGAQRCPASCESRLGFYDEPPHEDDQRGDYNEHFMACPVCVDTAANFRETDQRLGAWLETIGLPGRSADQDARLPMWTFMPAISAAIAFLVVITVALGVGSLLVGFDRVLGGSSAPSAIVPEPTESGVSGWLVTSTIDNVSAIDLGTGEHWSLVNVNVESGQPPIISLSPDGSKIALWTFQDGTRIASTIEVVSVDGEHLHTWRWDRQNAPGRFDGWLNERELLFVRAPGQLADESTEEFIQRQTRENELIVVNLETREQRTVFKGSVVVAVPSPDQRHIATLAVYDQSTAERRGRSLQIRPLEGLGLGEPVYELTDRYPLENTRPAWSSDGGTMYFLAVSGPGTAANDDDANQVIELVAWSHDHGARTVATGSPGTRFRLLGASPDGSNVIYLQSRAAGNSQEWDLSRAWLDDREPAVLAQSIAYPFFFSSGVTWLDGGERAIISDSQTHYFHQNDATSGIRAGSTRYLLVTNDVDVEVISTELGLWGVDAWGTTTLRWFDAHHFEGVFEREAPGTVGIFGTPEPVEDRGTMRFTADQSIVSPDGSFGLFRHTSTGGPLVWRFEQNAGRLLGGSPAPTDVSWAQGSPGLVGVQNDDEESLITVFAPRSTRIADFYDNRSGDPAQISENPDLVYARPVLSPDGNHLSFVVVDQESGTHELWVVSHESGQAMVYEWSVPEAALVAPPIIVTWTSPLTLLLSVPIEWDEGYPVEVALTQVQLSDQSDNPRSTVIEVIHRITPQGEARGITLEALEFNPRADLVAYRLRSYRSSDPQRSVRDAIVVASTGDVAQSITIARGRTGDGLAWSPDGEWLVYPVERGLSVSRWDGSQRHVLVEDDSRVRYPLWVAGDGIFYTRGSEDAPMLMRVAVR